jgi:adenylosuccinate synthase
MPVSIVVGGQFGSEGKGKVALEWVRRARASRVAVVRVGGPNSGHTAYDRSGHRFALRQLPAGALDRNVDVIFPPGSFIDLDVLQSEIELLDYPRDRIFVSPSANIITPEQKNWEREAGLLDDIGSTGSGVGAAVMAAVARGAVNFPLFRHDAQHCEPLEQYLADTTALMRHWLDGGGRIVVEGTQGFGLSLYDGGFWPKATARGTTAASALAESGLSPIDVDEVTLVVRSFPIRVGGNSGPLPGEITWEALAASLDTGQDLREYTTVTHKLRRIARFEPELVRMAIACNNPTSVIVNHMDYVTGSGPESISSTAATEFLASLEQGIGRRVDFVGFSPRSLIERNAVVA